MLTMDHMNYVHSLSKRALILFVCLPFIFKNVKIFFDQTNFWAKVFLILCAPVGNSKSSSAIELIANLLIQFFLG